MPQVAIELEVADQQQESARLAALYATGILDTPPEPGYDAITRLAAESRRPPFPCAPKACWLEIGFGAGEHLIAQAKANPEVGLIGCEPFLNGVAAALAGDRTGKAR